MLKCSVTGCKNEQSKNIEKLKFYWYPTNPNVRKQWLAAAGREWVSTDARICNEHFAEEDWNLQDVLLNVPVPKRRLKEGTVPTKKLPHLPDCARINVIHDTEVQKKVVKQALRTYGRCSKAKENKNGTELSYIIQNTRVNLIQNTEDQTELVNNSYKSYETCQTEKENKYIFDTNDEDCVDAEEIEYLEEETEAVQTEEESEYKIMTLENENKELKRENRSLRCELEDIRAIYASLSKIFTSGQMKRLKYPKRKTQWEDEDIESALGLYSASPKVYELLFQRQYPIPSTSTLRKFEKNEKTSLIGASINQEKRKSALRNNRSCKVTRRS